MQPLQQALPVKLQRDYVLLIELNWSSLLFQRIILNQQVFHIMSGIAGDAPFVITAVSLQMRFLIYMTQVFFRLGLNQLFALVKEEIYLI